MQAGKCRGAIRASSIVFAACGAVLALILITVLRNRREVSLTPEAALSAISSLHGVVWPTNRVTRDFTLWRYHPAHAGRSLNTETLARLEVGDDSFASWYSYATNILSEEKLESMSEDARLKGKASWWAPHELGEANGFLLSHELSQPTGVYSKLWLFVGVTGTNHVVYLHCLVRQP